MLKLRDIKNRNKYVIESPEMPIEEAVDPANVTDKEIRAMLRENLGLDLLNAIDGSYELNEKVKYLKGKLKEKKFVYNIYI